jgi:hypothetical protein
VIHLPGEILSEVMYYPVEAGWVCSRSSIHTAGHRIIWVEAVGLNIFVILFVLVFST